MHMQMRQCLSYMVYAAMEWQAQKVRQSKFQRVEGI